MQIVYQRDGHAHGSKKCMEGKVLECSRYCPIGARRLDDPDFAKLEPGEVRGRGWWETNTYL